MDALQSPYETLRVSISESDRVVLEVGLARRNLLNAVSFDMVLELHRIFDAVETIRQQKREDVAHDLRVMVLSFDGGCVGVDVASADADPDWLYQHMHSQSLLAALVEKLYRLPLVVVCVADGPVVGLGLALFLASDLRLATGRSTFRCGFR